MVRGKAVKNGERPRRQTRSTGAARIRMYRQGLGDCFLIALTKENGGDYFILIDCGVILGTSEGTQKMQAVVKDIIATTHGHLDLLIATHEHWDHLSGFYQARELFKELRGKIGQVWLAWTEDPHDQLARELRDEHTALRLALTSSAARMRMAGAGNSIVEGMLEFFGAAGQGTTGNALAVIKGLCDAKSVRYCRASDPPVKPAGIDARFYILGPPHDKKLIKKFNPSKRTPETYGLAGMSLQKLNSVVTDIDLDAPFDQLLRIPFEAASQMPFFRDRYWGEDECNKNELDQSWRRIDSDWLDESSNLALQLDSATNNTSLVLAIEFGNGEVLLFVADAQVGNWLSWQDLSWDVDGRKVTGPDLLRRTVFYKTGHHGSHNATLREKGLELMENLKYAMIPVDHAMALKKRWGEMPLDQILHALDKKTDGRVLRIDKPVPAALQKWVKEGPGKLYYELVV